MKTLTHFFCVKGERRSSFFVIVIFKKSPTVAEVVCTFSITVALGDFNLLDVILSLIKIDIYLVNV